MGDKNPIQGFFEGAAEVANDALKGAGQVFNDATKAAGDAANETGKKAIELATGTAELTEKVASESIKGFEKYKNEIMEKLDVNHDGTVDIQDIIIIAMRMPGVRVNREAFLRREMIRNYSQEQIEKAIDTNLIEAGVSLDEIDKMANHVIAFETTQVTGISAALGIPGGFAMLASIPTDIAQYYGYMLRAIQKLLYLYGFPEISVDEEDIRFDSETMNVLILCLGVMYGAAGARTAIQGLAGALAKGVEKQLLQKALTKGTIYPIVKGVCKFFKVTLTKKVFAGFFKKAIPIVGAAVSGAVTCACFITCCNVLKDSLKHTKLCQPDLDDDGNEHVKQVEESIANDSNIEQEVLEKVMEKNDFEIAELAESTD